MEDYPQLAAPRPPLVLVAVNLADAQPLFDQHVASWAIVFRFEPAPVPAEPKTPRGRFERDYQIVTPS